MSDYLVLAAVGLTLVVNAVIGAFLWCEVDASYDDRLFDWYCADVSDWRRFLLLQFWPLLLIRHFRLERRSRAAAESLA